MIPRESEVERRLVRWCREHDVYTRKFVSPAQRGVPDRILIANGRILFLELKRAGAVPTPLQTHELELLRARGMRALWAAGWEETKAILVHFAHPLI